MKQGTLFFKKVFICEFFCILLLFIDILFPLKFIKEAGFFTLSPVIFFSQNISFELGDFFHQLFNVREIYEENKFLKEENSELKTNKVLLKDLEEENKLLRETLSIESQLDFEKIEANVIINESNNALGLVIINRGQRDKISKGMPVVIGENLLGIVSETFNSYSVVTLVNSPQSKIPVRILSDDTNKSLSFVEGDFGLGMKLTKVDQDVILEEKAIIVTSGQGSNLPLNLVIGEIKEIYQMKKTELYQEAKVESNLDFNRLSKVLVILETEF